MRTHERIKNTYLSLIDMQVESYHIINMSRLTQNKYLAGTGVMPDEKKNYKLFFFFSYLNLPLENGPVFH